MIDSIETDEREWPIVVHRTIGIPPDAAVDAFIARADRILGRAMPHVVIFDSTLAGRATPYMRKRNVEWLKENQAQVSEHCVGMVMVLRSAALRFVVSTVMLVWQPVPYEVTSEIGEAMTWARRRITADAEQRRKRPA